MSEDWTRVRAVFCDMDGTLIDTDALWHRATLAAFARFGIRLSDQDFVETYGLDNITGVRFLLERHPGPAADEKAVVRALEEETESAYAQGVEPLPGAEALLRGFRARGYRLAVVSTSAPVLIRTAMAGLDWMRYFDLLLSSEEVGPGKPDPAVYREAARRLDVPPDQGLALEDTVFGVRSAHGAGLQVIGVTADAAKAAAMAPYVARVAAGLPDVLAAP